MKIQPDNLIPKKMRELFFMLKDYQAIAKNHGWNKQLHAIVILKLREKMIEIEREFKDG